MKRLPKLMEFMASGEKMVSFSELKKELNL